MIVADVIMLFAWWMASQYIFFWVFIGINVCVIAGEIVSFLMTGHTLSTNVTKALEKFREKRPWIYLALIALGLAIGFLIVHLAVW